MPSIESGARPAHADRPKEPPKRLFYKIGSVCELTGTQPYILRFWESEFPQLSPPKSRSGQRLFRERDVEMVRRIKRLLYEEGYTIAGARKRLEQEEAERPEPREDPPAQAAAAPSATLVTLRGEGGASGRRARQGPDDERKVKEMRLTLREIRKELQSILRRFEAR